MSSGLFRVAKGSGFTVCCFRLSVEGWETAQTELGPPMGGIPRLGGRGYIGRRGRRGALGGTSKAAGRSPRRFSDPRFFWRRRIQGMVLGILVCGLLFGDGKRPRRSWALRWGDSATRRSRLHRQERKTRSLGRDVQGGGQVSTAILRPALLLEKGEFRGLFAVWGRATAQTELGPPKEGEKGAAEGGSGL